MKDKKIRKSVSAVQLAGIMAVLLWGCSDRKVDYGPDSEEEPISTENSLAEFAEAGNWKDEWELELGDGKKLNLIIDAGISVPETEYMSVVEVEKLKPDGAMKQQFLEAFFGGGEIYYHDAEHLTREELENRIMGQKISLELGEDELNRLRNYIEAGVVEISDEELELAEEGFEREKEKLSRYENALETASDEPVPAVEYDSCGEYMAYINDVPYYVYFPEEGEEAVIRIQPGERYCAVPTYLPEALSDLKEYDFVSYSSDSADEAANGCPMTKKEAGELAERFMQSSGLQNQMLLREESLTWSGQKVDDEGIVTEESPYYAYGYWFIYGIGVNGLPFAQFGDEGTYMDVSKSGSPDFYSLDCRCSVAVTDDGIVGVELRYPMAVTNVTERVELLPLETVKSIMKNEAAEHTDRYDFTKYQYSNAMDLIYFRVQNKENPDKYSYIPVWRLSQKGEYCYHPILVNAIDGSVIYLDDEI